jgi:hypothetical protein
MRELINTFSALLVGLRGNHQAAASNAESEMSTAAAEIKAKGKVVAMLETEAAECQSLLEQADAKVKDASAVLESAREAYAEDPSASNAKAVRAARDSHELAEIARSKPERLAREAAASLENARSVLREAERAYEAAAFARELARLRVAASPEEFRSRTEPLFARIVAARTEMLEASAAIDAAFSDSNAASCRLVELGEEHTPLDGLHLMIGFAFEREKADPEGLGHIFTNAVWPALIQLTGRRDPKLSEILDVPVVHRILCGKDCRPPNPRPDYVELLRAVANAPDQRSRHLIFDERRRQELDETDRELQHTEAVEGERQEELAVRFLSGDRSVTRRSFGHQNLVEKFTYSEIDPPARIESSESAITESAAP